MTEIRHPTIPLPVEFLSEVNRLLHEVDFESKVLVLVGEHSATIYINGIQVYYAHGDMVDIVDTRVKIDYEDPMRTMQ